MIAARLVLVSLVAACGSGGGGGSAKPAQPTSPADGTASPAGPKAECRPAYAEYEQRWRTARSQELTDLPHAFNAAEIETIVSDEVQSLPARDELERLRLMYAVIQVFIPDAPWVVAFAAAERAIESCGEKAQRPT